MLKEQITFRPQPGPQEQFLASPADIVIYGGSAGGGKTWALLVEPLRHINNGDFGAVIFRRTYPEITNEGGMWDESERIYPYLSAKPVKGDLYWKFPSGMKVSFAHLQHETDVQNYQGSQIPLIGFDQLEHFNARMFFYMLSRNRSTCGVRAYVRGTCNPEPGWLADLLDWWIDDDGYAITERSGVIRWMIRDDKDLVQWFDTKQEALAVYPDKEPLSMTFIMATVYDNKILLAADPGYLANLKALPMVDRERLLGDAKRGGNWKIRPGAGKVFNRSWFDIVEAVPTGGLVERFWDFAATEKEISSDDPDYTASVLMMWQPDGQIHILDVTEERLDPAPLERTFVNISRQDAARFINEKRVYRVRWEQEGGSSGKRESWRMTTLLAGLDAKGVPSRGEKLVRAKPLAVQAEAGNVHLLSGRWNERFLNHMHGQPELKHDDIMDAASGAFLDLVDIRMRKGRSFQG